MSTRATYFAVPFTEPFFRPGRNLGSSNLARAGGVSGSVSPNPNPSVRRPLNDKSHAGKKRGGTSERVSARDLMSKAATLRPEDSVARAARVMSETRSSSLPVIDADGRLIGIISHRDITVRLIAAGVSIPHAQVSDCMTTEAFALSADSSLESCVSAMSWHQLRRLPIVDDDHRVVGSISRTDLIDFVSGHPQKIEYGVMADILLSLVY